MREIELTGAPRIPSRCAYCPSRRGDVCGAIPEQETNVLEDAKLADRVYRGHSLIVRQGEMNAQYYQLIDGWVILSHHDHAGVRKVLEVLVAGDSFGHLTSDSPASNFTAECLTDSSICAIPHSNLRTLVMKRPEVSLRISELTDRQHDHWHRYMIRSSRGAALSRLASFLSDIDSRRHRQRRKLPLSAVIPLRQSDIADAINLTPVYVNSLLKKLSNSGVIRIGRGRLTILDAKRLARIGEEEAPERKTTAQTGLAGARMIDQIS